MIAKKNIMVLDTETADLTGNVYDVGYVITNKRGEVLTTYNALVDEVITDPKKMMGAFFARKLFSHYLPMIDAHTVRLTPWMRIVERMRQDMASYNVNVLAAYNLGFDARVMRQTHDLFGDGEPICSDLEMLDIWQFACETKLSQRAYKKLARQMGWVSPVGNIRTGAEYANRFCSGDWGFKEAHTALDDALIETQILAKCYACKQRVPYGIINAHPWRIVNG